jgi:hypothetical protein
MFHKTAMNGEFVNTEPLFMGKIEGASCNPLITPSSSTDPFTALFDVGFC